MLKVGFFSHSCIRKSVIVTSCVVAPIALKCSGVYRPSCGRRDLCSQPSAVPYLRRYAHASITCTGDRGISLPVCLSIQLLLTPMSCSGWKPHDTLRSLLCPFGGGKHIFVAPTWRNWCIQAGALGWMVKSPLVSDIGFFHHPKEALLGKLPPERSPHLGTPASGQHVQRDLRTLLRGTTLRLTLIPV